MSRSASPNCSRTAPARPRAFWGLTATLERLHADRQLEEALTRGPDPLHLAAVFGIHENTAIRYAEAARYLLETTAERQAAGST
jgi:hypothetical protein